jgi:hypothetical protein
VTGPTTSSRVLARRLNVLYLVSFAAAAATVAAAAYLVSRVWPAGLRLPAVVVAVLLLVFAAGDLRLGPVRTLTLNRQTDRRWAYRFGLERATVLWGLDIGTTLSTIKMTSLYWAAFALVLSGPRPGPHLVVLLFAAGYLVTHMVVVGLVARKGTVDSAVARLNALPAHVRITSGILLAGLGLVMLVQSTVQ